MGVVSFPLSALFYLTERKGLQTRIIDHVSG